jgi:hypothetical protein
MQDIGTAFSFSIVADNAVVSCHMLFLHITLSIGSAGVIASGCDFSTGLMVTPILKKLGCSNERCLRPTVAGGAITYPEKIQEPWSAAEAGCDPMNVQVPTGPAAVPVLDNS